jgi:UDPglucose 6-dehydrogenase
MKKVGVVGVGYVGLTQAVGMAQLGHSVIAYDIDVEKITKLNNSNSPFFEPGLEEALIEAQSKNLISFTNDAETLIDAEYIFLCLPTPQDEDGSADLNYLLEAVNEIKDILKPNTYLIIKSTVPVNSWKQVEQIVEREDVFLISNPEFLREGSALFDFHNPDRIVIGATTKEQSQIVAEMYSNLSTEFVLTDNTSAELTKYAANSFLAIKLSFVNDIAALCENLNANSGEVLKGVGLDNRIGNKFLTPGPGWGGSCFPKDVNALARVADREKIMMPLLSAAIESNVNAQNRVIQKIVDKLGDLNGIRIGVLGLAFKANTDDTRNSPAIEIIRKLQALGAVISAYDPAVKAFEGFEVKNDASEVFIDADLLLVLTEWAEFAQIELSSHIQNMRVVNILDTRNIFELDELKKLKVNIIN